jgi:hypothetical protein
VFINYNIIMNNKYWLVGSMFGGVEDQLPIFIRRGYWYCWDPKIKPLTSAPDAVTKLFPLIEIGDRIAVKKMIGPSDPKFIEIRAIGVVVDVDFEEWRIYVKWLVTDLSRKVSIKGVMGSIHGPYEPSDWRAQVFEL